MPQFGANYNRSMYAEMLRQQNRQDQYAQERALQDEERRQRATQDAFGQIMEVMKLVDSRQRDDRNRELKAREVEARAAGELGELKPSTSNLPFTFGERGPATIDGAYKAGQVARRDDEQRFDYQQAMLDRQLQVEGARGARQQDLEKLRQLGRLEQIDARLDAKIEELEQRRDNDMDVAGLKGEIDLMLKERQHALDLITQADKYRRLGVLQDDRYDRIGELQEDRQEHDISKRAAQSAQPPDLLRDLERNLEKLATGKEGSFMEGMQYIPSAMQARERIKLISELRARGLSPGEILKVLQNEGFFDIQAAKTKEEQLMETLEGIGQ